MSSPFDKIKGVFTARPTLKHVSTLVGGTLAGQVLAVVTAPIILRMYSPEEMGQYTLFISVFMTVVAVAGLRYDMAIVLPKSHANARVLRNTVSVIIGIVSLACTIVFFICGNALAKSMGQPGLGPWLALAGIAIFTLAQVNSYNYWFTRTLQYKAISINKVQMSGSTAILQIVFALVSFGGIAGLIVGHLLGQGGAMATLMYKGRAKAENEGEPSASAIQLLRRYKKMPLLNAPNGLVDSIRLNGINMLIGALYSANTVGQFGQAWRLMQAPVTLITGAISQVFFQRFSVTEPGKMEAAVKQSVKYSLLLGIIPFLLMALLAPWIFPWFLGSGWEQSGLIGRALVPWLFLNVATSPISTVFVVTERQQEMLGFAVVYMSTGLGSVWGPAKPGAGIVATVWGLSLFMSLALVGMILLTIRAARIYDREGTTK